MYPCVSDTFSFQKYGIKKPHILGFLKLQWDLFNKMAQRALGRSPEEKVKGHSGAI